MIKLLTSDIWNQVAEKANGYEMKVAVAFVTDLGMLKMKKGDVLVCDVSDKNVSAGVVDRDILQKLYRKGVRIVHRENLHAKCARFGRTFQYTLVGSSNLSQNSFEKLQEVALITNDLIVGAKVDAQLRIWIDEGVKVDNTFIKRIMSLPRAKRFSVGKGKHTARVKKKELGDRIWVVGSAEADFTEDEQRVFNRNSVKAEERRLDYQVARYSDLDQLKWWGRNSFVKLVKVGDFIVEIFKRRVSLKIVLAVSRVGQEVYCSMLPVLGMRSRSSKDFNRALGISSKKLVYKNVCARLLQKKHLPKLKKLWSRVDWGDW